MLSPYQVRTQFVEPTTGLLAQWAQRWIAELVQYVNRPTPGPYVDDVAAKAANVAIGQQYYQPSGVVVVRLT